MRFNIETDSYYDAVLSYSVEAKRFWGVPLSYSVEVKGAMVYFGSTNLVAKRYSLEPVSYQRVI